MIDHSLCLQGASIIGLAAKIRQHVVSDVELGFLGNDVSNGSQLTGAGARFHQLSKGDGSKFWAGLDVCKHFLEHALHLVFNGEITLLCACALFIDMTRN